MSTYESDRPKAVKRVAETARVRVELGRRLIDLHELSQMTAGRVLALDCKHDEEVDVLVAGRLFARGELVVVDGLLAVRVTQVQAGAKRATSRPQADTPAVATQ